MSTENLKELPKVTIIIPCYNSEKYIKSAVESCINQTYQNIEIIVIDDGSTDNSKYKIQSFIKNKQIKYFYQENKERSAARNYGLELSAGEYINFLDSDDLLHASKIEKHVSYMKKNKECFATYSLVEYFSETNEKKITNNRKRARREGIVKRLILGNILPIQSVMFKKNEFRFDESMSALEDWDYLLKILYGKKVCYLDEILSSVRIDKQQSRENLLLMKKTKIEYLKMAINKDKYREHQLRIFIQIIKTSAAYMILKLNFNFPLNKLIH